MLVFLRMNGAELEYTQGELIDLGLSLAAGQRSYEEVLRWVLTHQE